MRTIDADTFDATMYEAWKNNEITNEEWIHFREMIKDEPTIEERKTGKWIEIDDAYNRISGRCSVCGWESHMYEDDVVGMNFCPNCGADMRGEQDA